MPRASGDNQDELQTAKRLPREALRLPLLETLFELGGRAALKDVCRILEAKIASRLSEADRLPVSSGHPHWWNAACWERYRLVREGLFRSGSARGIWELTERGRRFVEAKLTQAKGS